MSICHLQIFFNGVCNRSWIIFRAIIVRHVDVVIEFLHHWQSAVADKPQVGAPDADYRCCMSAALQRVSGVKKRDGGEIQSVKTKLPGKVGRIQEPLRAKAHLTLCTWAASPTR